MTHSQPPRRPGSQPPEPERDLGRIDIPVALVQPPRPAPRLNALVWLAAALVVIAVLKPWGGGGRVAETLRPDAAGPVDVTPAPTEDRSATGLALPICLGTGAWRVATLETWRSRDVRVWRAIEPIAKATGPTDPAIPSVPVVADVLGGLGWCAPAFGDGQPAGPATVRAWAVADGAARAISLRQVQPVDGVTPIAALYLPAGGAWTSGRVVFEYTDDGSDLVAWFAADLQILPPPSPGPSPDGATALPSG